MGITKRKLLATIVRWLLRSKGVKLRKNWIKYEYIYTKNLPEAVSFIGAEFYFQKFEETDAPFCLGNTYSPHHVNISAVSMSKP
jgi:hypothetical protein